jgi:hypothetical protein
MQKISVAVNVKPSALDLVARYTGMKYSDGAWIASFQI